MGIGCKECKGIGWHDDWCLAQQAREVAREEMCEEWLQRANEITARAECLIDKHAAKHRQTIIQLGALAIAGWLVAAVSFWLGWGMS